MFDGLRQIYIECDYINGEKSGLYKESYKNSNIKIEATYLNNFYEGLYQHWFEDGIKNEF